MPTLSVVVITRNEEANLARCLKSIAFADEIIVVDSHSTDRTPEVAAEFGARFFKIDWTGFGAAKQSGVDRAKGDWILSLDADEELTPELAGAIRRVVASDGPSDGYYLGRITRFMGRWIEHSGWYPEFVLRLFKKDRGRLDGAVVHEKIILDGSSGRLDGDLKHYSYDNLGQYFEKFNRYTSLSAEQMHRRGREAGLYDITMRPLASFFKHYAVGQGFLDGLEGLVLSLLSAAAVLVKYAKLIEMNRARDRR